MNKVICDDCRNIGGYVERNSVDIVITSPPYNVNLGSNKYNKRSYDLYCDNMDHKGYIIGLKTRFANIQTRLKDGARVCINIGDGKNGKVPTSSDIIQFMTQDLRFLMTAHIIWNKSQVGNRTAWGSFKSPSNPSFPLPYEHILIFSHKQFKKEGDKEDITISKQEFIDFSLGLWSFPGRKDPNHPAPFPNQLPYRLIQMLSYKGDVVLDPFCGSGTTLVEAKKLGRQYIGFDISQEYVNLSERRLLENY